MVTFTGGGMRFHNACAGHEGDKLGELQRKEKPESISVEEFTDFFEEAAGASGTKEGDSPGPSGTDNTHDPGQPGPVDTVDATDVLTYISTAEAARLAGVDSRTIRRWHEQEKVAGRFSKSKLLIARESLLSVLQESDFHYAGASGTEKGDPPGPSGTDNTHDPGQPGQSADKMQTPALAFMDLVDRIERLSRENGELKAMLDEQRRENQQIKLLVDSQHKVPGWWARFSSWFKQGNC